MNAKTIFTFAGGVVVGLILGAWLFSGPSSQVSQVPTPVTPSQPQVDTIRLQQEVTQLEDLVKNDPENYQAWKKLGDNLFDIGEFQRAVDAYGTALALDDSDPNVWTDMGVMYRKLGNPEKALEAFDEAIKRGPTHTISRLNKGVVYIYDLKDIEKGVAAWEDFLRVQPSGPQADNIRGELEKLGRMKAARESGTLPPDHPTVPSGEPGGASGEGDPAGYFPKPQ